ncbi:hypothetical protein [Parvibium lacunae]|uniref:hypothetical protein n=1 Tax=Parvibium lacunae TaxID=1888893 RepID=UPI0018644E01|nr:hypothetical protein [Parvibium lacunae]
MSRSCFVFGLVALSSVLLGCDQLGIETPDKVNARQEAEGKAIGAACRHVGRSIEDCYALNTNAKKAAVFDGWKEMNDYMRENKIETVVPASSPPELAKPKKPEKDSKAAASHEPKEVEGKAIERGKSRDSYTPVEGEYVPPIPKSRQKQATN